MPLAGKVPIMDSWPTMPPATEAQVREWVEDDGYNLGLRTGRASGMIVIDDDQHKHGVANPWHPPPTDLIAESPTGGRHYYYRLPPGAPIGNSASKLAPYVDVRGEGGQCVYPGSAHPVTRTPYTWFVVGEPGVLPEATLAALREAPALDLSRPSPPPVQRGSTYQDSALHREVHSVRTASEGARNNQLNKAAFNLGTLVASGALDRETVEAELASAAAVAGLPAHEAAATIRSGLAGGGKHPRSVPDRPAPGAQLRPRPAATDTPTRAPVRPDVLVPGSHNLPPTGEYQEQGTDSFAAAVLAGLPDGSVYRRAEIVGQVVPDQDGRGASFRAIAPDAFRSVVDHHMRLGAGKALSEPALDGSPQYAVVYRNCLRDHAAVVLAYAETAPGVRELRHLATHPVCLGRDFQTAQPSWNQAHGVYLAVDHVPDPLPLDTARAVLEDLVCDFPFQAPADRANYYGLLLTPILRPAIPEPVPMHLIGSPVERTGKTKLAEIVLGCAVLGRPTPALQIGVREEEREKRITSLLLSGASVAHLDNLREFVDSAALASLLTSTTYQGRELGLSRIVSIPNGLTLVASGNNIHATGEVAKRIVPIRLLPPTESPETRQDYKHPLLKEYVESQRPRVLGALLGLVEAWRAAGRPLGSVGFGGFERWSAVLGGIMRVAGFHEWMGNVAEWRGDANDFGSELTALVEAWRAAHGEAWVATADLFKLAIDDMGLFARQTGAPTERGQKTAFGQRVLNAAEGRVVDGWRVELTGQGKRRRARLVPAQPAPNLGPTTEG